MIGNQNLWWEKSLKWWPIQIAVSYTHLGPDLASIAREKAGIIKPGIPLVLGKLEAEASQVIEAVSYTHQMCIRDS